MAKESAYFHLHTPADKHHAKEIKQTLGSIRGVLSVAVGDEHDTVSVDFDNSGTDSERIGRKLQDIGINAYLERDIEHKM